MNRNIVFIGGIHGVGKGTLCEKIKSLTDVKYLSASELLNWDELNFDKKNKKVLNINSTQERFIFGLKRSIDLNQKYILDGHFCLLKTDESIERVPYSVFEQIDPLAIILVIENPKTICERLSERDKKKYNVNTLSQMQIEESIYAKEICEKFNIELLEIRSNQIDVVLTFLNRKFQISKISLL